MKILIVLPNDSLGGAEQYLKMIAAYYKDQDVSIYFFKNNNSKKWDNLNSHSSQHFLSSKNEIFGLLAFVLFMIKKRPVFDHVFTSHIYTNSIVGLLRKFKIIKTKKFIARESTSIFLRYKGLKLMRYKLLYRIGYHHIDLLICQTSLMKDQLFENFNNLQRHVNIQVIPNPINLKNSEQLALESLDSKYDFEYIVSAGRLIEVKGFDILIKAFANIKHHNPELKLVILGEGSLRQELEQLMKSLEIEQDIYLVGQVNNVYNFFKNARLCVVSSRIEGFPNVLLQMMSVNNNVVSTTCAGGIEHIKGLYTCSPNSVDELSLAITSCLAVNNDTNRELFDNHLSERDIGSFIDKVNLLSDISI